MTSIDPEGTLISSVLGQHGIDAQFSGATRLQEEGRDCIEGVAGPGDDFMLGRQAPDHLPTKIVQDVGEVVAQLRDALGDVRIEWAHDGEIAWVLQLHIAGNQPQTDMFKLGTAKRWLLFDPDDGLDKLRELVRVAHDSDSGVEIIRPVGMTSHVGEILREARVPARLSNNVGQPKD